MTDHLPTFTRAAVEHEVRFAERIIDALAVPYDVEVDVDDVYGTYGETIARGAFEGIEKRQRRVKVLRDHELTRAIGRCTTIDSTHERGLLASCLITRTPLGDETLALAQDGVLDLSIAAYPLPGGDEWSADRRQVRRTRLFLQELSLVPFGVYGEVGAGVLAVRRPSPDQLQGVGPATPRLDQVRAWRAERRYSAASRPPA